MKKIISFILVLIFSLGCVSPAANAIALGITDDGVVSLKEAAEIESLYAERRILTLNFEANADKIAAIDDRLHTLGVKRITAAEARQAYLEAENVDAEEAIAANAAPLATDSTDDEWEMYITRYNYNGLLLELKIQTLLPTSIDSDLAIDQGHVVEDVSIFIGQALAKRVFKVAVEDALSNLLGTGLVSCIDTFYDIASGVAEDLNPDTIVTNVISYIDVAGTTEIKNVYVRTAGSNSAYTICYCGNSVEYIATMSYHYKFLNENGVLQNVPVYEQITGEISSPYYESGLYNIVCSNYMIYRNGYPEGQEPYQYIFYMYSFDVTFEIQSSSGSTLYTATTTVDVPWW